MPTFKPTLLTGLVDFLLDVVCVVDFEGRFVFVSAAAERVFGYKPEEMVGTKMIDMVAPEDCERTLEAAKHIISGHPNLGFENQYIRKDRTRVHIMWSAQWLEEHQFRVAVARDITQRKIRESIQAAIYAISEAAHSAENLPSLFDLIHGIIEKFIPCSQFSVAICDENTGNMDFCYHAGDTRHLESSHDAALMTFCHEVARATGPLFFGATEARDETTIVEPPTNKHCGVVDNSCWIGVPLRGETGSIGALIIKNRFDSVRYSKQDQDLLHFVSNQIATAIERKQLQARLRHAAQHDDLTSLANRKSFCARLTASIARAKSEQSKLAVLYIDLDRFKEINDSLGHAAGDLVLKETATRLFSSLRNSDMVSRFGGDEFVVLLEQATSLEIASRVAKKIRNVVSQPVSIAQKNFQIFPSIGIALYPDDGKDVEELIQHADAAMYEMKKRNHVVLD